MIVLLIQQERLPSWTGSVCAQYWEGVTCISGSVAAVVLPSRMLQGERFAAFAVLTPSMTYGIPSKWSVKYPFPNLLCRDVTRVVESSC